MGVGVGGASRQELKARSAILGKNLEFSLEGRGREVVAEAKDIEGGRKVRSRG